MISGSAMSCDRTPTSPCGRRRSIIRRATGYRLEFENTSIAYVTDTVQHRPDQLDRNVLWLAHDADVLIYDCNFTEEEFSRYVGWGHSTWKTRGPDRPGGSGEEAGDVHHDPDHNDEFRSTWERSAQLHADTIAASEGLDAVDLCGRLKVLRR